MASPSRVDLLRPRRSAIVLGSVFVGYLAIGVWATAEANLVMGDGLSRLANSAYVLFSRDPHLTAIGFVWNPFPSLVMLVPLSLRPLWQGHVDVALAGTVVTAAAMATAVESFRRITVRWRFPRWLTVALTVAFGANPLIVLYATNAMSEAFLLALLVPAVGSCADWIWDRRDHRALVRTAVLVGLAYLVRYEALATAAAVAGVVALVSATDHRPWDALGGRQPTRWARQIAAPGLHVVGDVITFLFPAVTAFVVFAGSSWLVTGSLLEQFTSTYGNTSVVGADGTSGLGPAVTFVVSSLAVTAPLALPALAWVFGRGRREDAAPLLALVSILGSVLAVAALFQLSGSTLPFLRFFIAGIPLQLLALGLVVGRGPEWSPLARVPVCALLVASVVATGWGMFDRDIGVQEHHLATRFGWRDDAAERATLRAFQTEGSVAAYLDGLDLAEGTVLIDVLFGFDVVLSSAHPDRFVIPSDRDWSRHLADPWAEGIEYLVVVDDADRGSFDALNRRFPGVFADGGGVASVDMVFDNDGAGPDWKVLRLRPAP